MVWGDCVIQKKINQSEARVVVLRKKNDEPIRSQTLLEASHTRVWSGHYQFFQNLLETSLSLNKQGDDPGRAIFCTRKHHYGRCQFGGDTRLLRPNQV